MLSEIEVLSFKKFVTLLPDLILMILFINIFNKKG